MNPLVSVIMPSYNCADFIGDAIDSALNQDYDNIELIVVDDGSSDDTISILDGYGDRIRWVQQENAGAAAARNHGMSIARGDYISFLDADDLWHPQKIGFQCRYLESNPNVGLVYCGWVEWFPDQADSFTVPADFYNYIDKPSIDADLSGWIYTHLLMDCVVHTITAFFRRSVYQKIGNMNQQLVTGEDYDYWLRISRHFEIHKLSDVMSLYRIRSGSLARTAHDESYELQVIDNAIRQWGLKSPDGVELPRKKYSARMSGLWYSHAYTHFHNGNLRHSINAAKKAIRIRPLWKGGWKYLVLGQMKLLFGR